ncbi:MAG: glycosyltransferase family 4 protein [Erysipelotrichaceae bacterium]|nr:glycosyltransferase family 4 protein [Erysipelotrichaceae bacterium]
MRVLILANSCVGLYKFRKEVLQELVKNHEVFASLPDGEFNPQIEEIGVKIIETPIERRGTNPVTDLKLMKRYKEIIDEVKPDIVLTYTIKPNVYGGMAAQLKKVPYVVNITGLGSAVENGGILQFITVNLYKLGIRKAQKVFFQNEANRDFMIEKKVVKDNYDLLPGSGVNVNQYVVSEYPDRDSIEFVYVGRMMAEKGYGLYIDAAKIIKEKYPNTVFHICGAYEDDYREKTEKLISDGILVFHGLVDNMVEIYDSIDCLIHPTYYPEGMSNVLLEASACGRPVITTDRPGCREIVDDGINGFVVKQKDLDSLIEKIEKFIGLTREERKQMGLNGRKKVEKDFDRKIVIDKYLEEINKVK